MSSDCTKARALRRRLLHQWRARGFEPRTSPLSGVRCVPLCAVLSPERIGSRKGCSRRCRFVVFARRLGVSGGGRGSLVAVGRAVVSVGRGPARVLDRRGRSGLSAASGGPRRPGYVCSRRAGWPRARPVPCADGRSDPGAGPWPGGRVVADPPARDGERPLAGPAAACHLAIARGRPGPLALRRQCRALAGRVGRALERGQGPVVQPVATGPVLGHLRRASARWRGTGSTLSRRSGSTPACRRDEALRLEWADVDLAGEAQRAAEVHRRNRRRSLKTPGLGGGRALARRAGRHAGRVAAGAAGSRAWVFPGVKRTGPWTGGTRGKRAGEILRLAAGEIGLAGVTPDTLRHSFATAPARGLVRLLRRSRSSRSCGTPRHARRSTTSTPTPPRLASARGRDRVLIERIASILKPPTAGGALA